MLYSNFGYILLGDIVRRVSGLPFWQFVRSRLFEPLGMHDSYFVLPPELQERRVYRAPGMPATEPAPIHRGIDSPEYHEIGFASGGAASTARDLAAFLQMLLNRGSYGSRQILSRASVAAMTRHQVDDSIPQIMPVFRNGKRLDFEFRGGGYGYGLFIFRAGDRFMSYGALASLSAFGHVGYGGSCMWADPEREVVGIYLSVSPRFNRDIGVMNSDLRTPLTPRSSTKGTPVHPFAEVILHLAKRNPTLSPGGRITPSANPPSSATSIGEKLKDF